GTAHWANLGIAVESTTAVEIVAHEAAATGADTRLEVDWALEAAVPLLPDPVVATPTPSFASSTLPNLGATIGYWFRIATNPDATSGGLINSGWLTTPTWRPPVGALAEGPTYYWSVVVTDGVQTHASAPRPLRVDRRLGVRPGGAIDTLGPLSVNLATGALSFGLSTRAIPSAAGPLAASLTYNSSAPAPHGLTGRYWSGCDPSGTALSPPGPAGAGFVRTDATIDFSWTSSEPAGPGLGPGRCIVWTGYLSLKIGPTFTYDPYGNPTAAVPDNATGDYDFAWLGAHHRFYEHESDLSQIHMGARLYDPTLGRFLPVDPIEGGSANDYEYCFGDPINNFDVSGEFCLTIGPVSIGGCGLQAKKRDIKAFDAAIRECERQIGRRLTGGERRRLHEAIHGQNFDFRQIVDQCLAMFGGLGISRERPYSRGATPWLIQAIRYENLR
ncbi:MAG: RHS repeat-associated core domain-containing protein, partial [Acidimicrobiales bacterium]